MQQTFIGLGWLMVGLAIILLNDQLARMGNAINRRILGVEFPGNWQRGSTIFVGALMAFCGLLIVFRLIQP